MVVCIEQITQRVQRGALLITLIVVPLLLDEPRRRGSWKHAQYQQHISILIPIAPYSRYYIFRVVIVYRGIETGIEISVFFYRNDNNVDFYRTTSKLSIRYSTPTTVIRTWAHYYHMSYNLKRTILIVRKKFIRPKATRLEHGSVANVMRCFPE